MIQYNPMKKSDGTDNGALSSAPSASLVFDLPGRAMYVKGVKFKGTDHTYTFSHDNYITLTITPSADEGNDVQIGINIQQLRQALIPSQSYTFTASLTLAQWTNVATINTLPAGIYAISIRSGTLYAGGIFAACGGTDTRSEEIILHTTDTASNSSWLPYAKTSGNYLQMATNEVTSTSREYTIIVTRII